MTFHTTGQESEVETICILFSMANEQQQQQQQQEKPAHLEPSELGTKE